MVNLREEIKKLEELESTYAICTGCSKIFSGNSLCPPHFVAGRGSGCAPVSYVRQATLGFITYVLADCPGLVTKIISADGDPLLENETLFEYSSSDCNLTKVTDPLLRVTSFTYKTDGSGNIDTITDGESKLTSFTYDAMNRLLTVTDADTEVTTYEYDDEGNIEKVIDAKTPAGETEFTYDELNRLKTVMDPLDEVETYTYDNNGNLDTIVDRKDQLIDFEYDAVNRLITKTLLGALVTDYTYDDLDNLETVTDPDSLITFDYDDTGRLIQADTTGTSLQPDVVLDYVYDKNGNRDTLSRKIGAGTSQVFIDYAFDNLNRIDTLQNVLASLTIDIDHDVLSRRDLVTYPNNTTVDYTYDLASQLTSIIHKLSGTPFSQYDYSAYDLVGNREQVDVTRAHIANLTGQLNYIYDSLYRLTDATYPITSPTDENFVYDEVGNRLRKQGQLIDSVFDAANRLLNDQVFTYTYDDNGNLKTKTEIAAPTNVTTYTYDAENQLIRIDEQPSGNVYEYKYDGLGRRIQKDVNGVKTTYVYDGEDILFEFDSSDNLVARYTHGVGIDEPLIMERDLDLSGTFEATEQFFYHTDGLGSVSEITDNTGSIVESYVYDSFGNVEIFDGLGMSLGQSSAILNPYMFTARRFDEESGLYYYRNRQYDPGIGRFTSRDPIGYTLDSLNLYTYVGNNPVRYTDPFGLYQYETTNLGIAFLHESNPFNTDGAFFQQATSIGSFFGGDLAAAAALSGQSIVEDTNTECGNSTIQNIYTGTQVVAGAATAVAAGAIAFEAAGYSAKFGYHKVAHPFKYFGQRPHLQLNTWKQGVSGSGKAFRIPLPWRPQ